MIFTYFFIQIKLTMFSQFFVLTWTVGSMAYPMEPTNRTEEETAVDGELGWYKPVAVILKPATERDLQERLLQAEEEEDPYMFHRYNQFRSAPPPWLSVPEHPPYDPWADLHQGRHFGREDRLSDVYQRFKLPSHVQGNLLSLARMGLVAIPAKEIGLQNRGSVEEEEQQQSEDALIKS